MTTPSIDVLGETFLVREENADTYEMYTHLLTSWREAAQQRAATFDRTARRKAAFHEKRLLEITGDSSSVARKRAVAEQAVEHWKSFEGQGETLVEQFITGLEQLPQTRISQVASWAVWDERDPEIDEWYRPRHALDTVVRSNNLPHTETVFLGLNAALTDQGPSEAWSMFHGSPQDGFSPAQQAHIRHVIEALRGTPLWGSYMTTFYKNLPRVDEQTLKALLDTASTQDKRNLTTLMGFVLRDEFAVFGVSSQATCIAFGGRTANLMRSAHDADVIEIPHYATQVKAEVFDAHIDEVLALTHHASVD